MLVDALNVARSRWPNMPPDRVVELTDAWAATEGVEPLVVFDRAVPPGCDRSSVVGTGDGTADDWIIERVLSLAAARPVWLVTSDRELRRRAEPYVERTIGGGSFAGLLEALYTRDAAP